MSRFRHNQGQTLRFGPVLRHVPKNARAAIKSKAGACGGAKRGLRAGELMRRSDAKPRRAARLKTIADPALERAG